MKIKKVISGIMAVLVVFGAVPVFSADPVQDHAATASAYVDETYENLRYEKHGYYIEITGCDESAAEVEIPVEIEELLVTEIGDGAFSDCSGLMSITIPNSVTSIGGYAFYNCSSLESITIPDSVTSIGDGAFYDCKSLKSITIPDSVTSIGDSAFSNCSGLTSITIPDGITSIGDSAFYNCSRLESIMIPDSVTSIGDYAFYKTPWLEARKKENPLVIVNNILISGNTCEGEIVIPDGVTIICGSAFYGCSGLTEIILPESVTSIGGSAFEGCSRLESITIPNSVTIISAYMFNGCNGLAEIIIPDSVTSIGKNAFADCESLESITILNPDCEIRDLSSTISNGYYLFDKEYLFDGKIRGYSGSTAQEYAEKYGRNFESIGEIEIPETLLGDANCDGEVSVADATLVLQYCGNKDKYKLSEQGLINADVDGTAGISAVDALRIQQYDAGVIDKF